MNDQKIKSGIKNIFSSLGSSVNERKKAVTSEDTLKFILFGAAAVLLSLCRLYGVIMPLFYPFAAYVLINERKNSAAAYLGALSVLITGGVLGALRCIISLSFIALLPRLKTGKLSSLAAALGSFASVGLSGALLTYITGQPLITALYYIAEGVFCMSLYPIFMCGIAAVENIKNKVVFTSQDRLCICAVAACVISGFSPINIAGGNLAFAAVCFVVFVSANCVKESVALSYALLAGVCLSLFAGFDFIFISVIVLAAFCAELFAPISKLVSVFTYTAVIALGGFLSARNYVLADSVCCAVAAAAFLVFEKKLEAFFASYRRRPAGMQGLYKEAVQSVIKNEINSQKSMLTEISRNLNTPPADDESSIPRFICATLSSDVCSGCVHYTRCWKSEAEDTLRCFSEIIRSMASNGASARTADEKLASRCPKSQLMIKTVGYIYDTVRLKHSFGRKLTRFKKLLNMQYEHLNSVLDRLYSKLSGGIYVNTYDAEAALSSIQNSGIPAEKLYIIEDFDRRARATLKSAQAIPLDELKYSVAEIISDSTGRELSYDYTFAGEKISGEYTYEYAEKYAYCLSVGHAAQNKDDTEVSGDNSANTVLSSGMQVIAVCDGMGSGESASRQSCRVLDMLEELLNAGYTEAASIEIINSILVLDDSNEIFAALDMFIFDLNRGLGEFIKAGGAPSFIKRAEKEKVETVTFDSLPVGILEDTHIRNTMAKFSKGDFVYMMSDGYFECIGNDAEYARSKIKELTFRNPQKTAEALLSDALAKAGSAANDDISVVVVKIRRS